MKSTLIVAAAAAAFAIASPAMAQIAVDGTRDAAYGTPKSTVIYNPAGASYNFSSSNGNFSEATGYDIYLTSDANFVYGFLQTTLPGGVGAGSFANLYFDLDRQNGNGADLGFEITNRRAFAFGDPFPTYANLGTSLLNYSLSSDGTGLEFSLANSLFTGPIAGLNYEFGPNQQFATNGGPVTLRLSQAFNYTVAGGSVFGDNRLGTVTVGGNATGAVPEPAAWAMMFFGFGGIGFAMRRRKSAARAAVKYA